MERVHHWSRLTTDQLAQFDRKTTVVLLPMGHVQPHGPHLPQGTARYIARHIAHETADLLTLTDRDRSVLLLPTLAYGAAPVEIPGQDPSGGCSLVLQPATLEAVITDLVDGIVCAGFRAFFSIGQHPGAGHCKAIQRALAYMRRRNSGLIAEDLYSYLFAGAGLNAAPDLRTLTRRRISPREQAAIEAPEHGGTRATSMMLALDSNLVGTEYVALPEISREQLTELNGSPGYFGGAPALANADLGRALLSQQAYRATALIREALAKGHLEGQPHYP